MLQLPHPDVSAREAYLTCVSSIRDAAKKEAFEQAVDPIDDAALKFEESAIARKLHLLKPSEFQPEREGLGLRLEITSEDLRVKLYERSMVRGGSAGRTVYDQIMLGAPNGTCPLCGVRIAKTLDHYLPRSKFAALSVAPLNLIPACIDCNQSKRNESPTKEEEQTLSPYFEDVTGAQWLRCRVVEGSPATVSFFVGEPPEWPRVLIERVKYHFEVFKIAELYPHNAIGEMISIRRRLRDLLATGDAESVRTHLEECAESAREPDLNSWRGAMYEALACSDWYCSGGFDV